MKKIFLIFFLAALVSTVSAQTSWYGTEKTVGSDLEKLSKANINTKDCVSGATILHAAATLGSSKLVKAALDKGADVLALDNSKWTPAHHLMYSAPDNPDTVEALKLLLDAMKAPGLKSKNGKTLLHAGLRTRLIKPQCLKLLLDKGADINAKDETGITPFMLVNSAKIYSPGAINVIFTAKPDVNAQDNFGKTAIMHSIAAHGCSQRMWKLPASMASIPGIDLNIADKEGNTALHYTVMVTAFSGKKFAFRVTLSNIVAAKGGDVNKKNKHGDSPLSMAVDNNHLEIAKLFIEKYKADVNTQNGDGRTPLGFAAGRGDIAFCRYLLKHGADVDIEDDEGHTAKNWASPQTQKALGWEENNEEEE